jgi:pyruvate dehydrogenase E2 component (dihydrolipoamide acetyltransferase)
VRAAESDKGSTIVHSAIRKTIAERMKASHLAAAPVTLTTTADATDLVRLRNQFKSTDLVPSYTDFLMKMVAIALQKHPLLNSRWSEDRIVVSTGIHIGFAVDTDAGLVVPVLRDVPTLALNDLASRSRELIERALSGRLTATEMQGGTFTVTNLGAFGIDAFTPIINPPQCAILGVGRIQRQPVVIAEQIVIRDRIALSLTFDHRIVDGAPAARFLQTLMGLIEDPSICLIHGDHG